MENSRTNRKIIYAMIFGLLLGIGIAKTFVSADPNPVVDSVTGKTWLADRDRLRAQWLNGNFQALFNWANGGIDENNLATAAAIPFSKIDFLSGKRVETHTASAGQTLFTLANSYTTGENRVEVDINGVLQHDFTETSSQSVTLGAGILAGWKVRFILY